LKSATQLNNPRRQSW